jgi:Carboxypeptidase regulatory-like domain
MSFPLRSVNSVVVVVWTAAILASCATEPASSGIKGQVTVDGGCPEIRNSPPCSQLPLPARISIRNISGTTVREATSSDQGEFQLELPAGTYEVQAENLSGAPLPYAPPQQVVVEAGSYTKVNLAFDSGVR